jgi:hypothetical protein
MKTVIVFCLIASQYFFAFGYPRFAPREHGQSPVRSTTGTDIKRVWRPGSYRGLTMGASNVDEMRRILGAPKRSETFNKGTSDEEVWYHYEGSSDFPGTIRVIVVKAAIRAIDILPKDLNAEDAIKHFGPDYLLTRYDFDSCLGDEESAPLFESPSGSVVYIEYRQRGIAISVNGVGKVNEIQYINEPIGAESSKCK